MSGVKGQVQRRGQERRRAILAAALAVFAESGPNSGGLAEIAERAGTTRAGVLHHFGTKEELLLAAIRERDASAFEEFKVLTRRGGLDMLRGLVRFAHQAEREADLFALHTALLAQGLHQPTVGGYFAARSRGVIRALGEGLARGQGRGEIRSDVDCQAVARQILAFQEGAALLCQLVEGISLVVLYEDYIETLISSIAA